MGRGPLPATLLYLLNRRTTCGGEGWPNRARESVGRIQGQARCTCRNGQCRCAIGTRATTWSDAESVSRPIASSPAIASDRSSRFAGNRNGCRPIVEARPLEIVCWHAAGNPPGSWSALWHDATAREGRRKFGSFFVSHRHANTRASAVTRCRCRT